LENEEPKRGILRDSSDIKRLDAKYLPIQISITCLPSNSIRIGTVDPIALPHETFKTSFFAGFYGEMFVPFMASNVSYL
jgi:hypothetical protein